MPLTWSQKEQDEPLHASSSALQRIEELSEQTRTEGSTSVANSEATASISSITESTGTTATNFTVAMKMRSIEASARLKELEMTDRKNLNSCLKNMISSGSIRASVKSDRSTSKAARLRILESREELARLELQRIEAVTNLARIKFERQTLEDKVDDLDKEHEDRTSHVQNRIQTSLLGDMKDIPEQDLHRNENIMRTEQLMISSIQVTTLAALQDKVDDLGKEHEDRTSHVQNCIQTSPLGDMKDIPEQVLHRNRSIMKTEQPMISSMQVTTLADSIPQAFDNHTPAVVRSPPPLSQQATQDLPFYDGTSTEWMDFRVVYDETSKSFTPTQNMARLRKALKGAARNTFKSLLYSDATPDQFMKDLQRRYGRPDSLVREELDRIKALPKIAATPKDICGFASDIDNCISAIQGLTKPQYLCSPLVVRKIVEKLQTYLKFCWYEYANVHEEQEPADLVLMAQFLSEQADTCGANTLSEKKKQQRGRYLMTSWRAMTHTATDGAEIDPQSVKNKVKIANKTLGDQSRRTTTDSQEIALAIFEKTYRRREGGRYEIGLLWKDTDDPIPDKVQTVYTGADGRNKGKSATTTRF